MTTAAPSAARPLAIPAAMPFDAPVTTAVLPDNLLMTFHPPNFPSTDVLANLRKETADRGGDRSFVDGCREPMAHFHRYRRALFPRQRCELRSYPAGTIEARLFET